MPQSDISSLALANTLKFWLVSVLMLLLPMQITAEQNGCASHRQLIDASRPQLGNIQPCDMIGATYMAGFGIGTGNSVILDGNDDLSRYPYYPLFRSYLEAQLYDDQYTSEETLGFLLLGLAIAPEIGSSLNGSDLRGNYYSAFAVAEYWRHNLGSSRELPLLFEDALLEWMRDGALNSANQLRCFIQHDIPTLQVDEIISSERFSICAGGS